MSATNTKNCCRAPICGFSSAISTNLVRLLRNWHILQTCCKMQLKAIWARLVHGRFLPLPSTEDLRSASTDSTMLNTEYRIAHIYWRSQDLWLGVLISIFASTAAICILYSNCPSSRLLKLFRFSEWGLTTKVYLYGSCETGLKKRIKYNIRPHYSHLATPMRLTAEPLQRITCYWWWWWRWWWWRRVPSSNSNIINVVSEPRIRIVNGVQNLQ